MLRILFFGKFSSDFRRFTFQVSFVLFCLQNKLVQSGFIYKGRYEGWYSVQDEAFLGDRDIETTMQNGKEVKVRQRNSLISNFS